MSRIPEGNAGDVRTSNVLALAYIRPVYSQINQTGTGFAQQFLVNINDGGEPLTEIISFDNDAATGQDPRFWTVYLLNAYQPEDYRDLDPYTERPQDDLPIVGFTEPGLASLVYVEPSGAKECSRWADFTCNISVITAREVAKALGAEDGDGWLLNLALNDSVLSPVSLRKIRQQPFP